MHASDPWRRCPLGAVQGSLQPEGGTPSGLGTIRPPIVPSSASKVTDPLDPGAFRPPAVSGGQVPPLPSNHSSPGAASPGGPARGPGSPAGMTGRLRTPPGRPPALLFAGSGPHRPGGDGGTTAPCGLNFSRCSKHLKSLIHRPAGSVAPPRFPSPAGPPRVRLPGSIRGASPAPLPGREGPGRAIP